MATPTPSVYLPENGPTSLASLADLISRSPTVLGSPNRSLLRVILFRRDQSWEFFGGHLEVGGDEPESDDDHFDAGPIRLISLRADSTTLTSGSKLAEFIESWRAYADENSEPRGMREPISVYRERRMMPHLPYPHWKLTLIPTDGSANMRQVPTGKFANVERSFFASTLGQAADQWLCDPTRPINDSSPRDAVNVTIWDRRAYVDAAEVHQGKLVVSLAGYATGEFVCAASFSSQDRPPHPVAAPFIERVAKLVVPAGAVGYEIVVYGSDNQPYDEAHGPIFGDPRNVSPRQGGPAAPTASAGSRKSGDAARPRLKTRSGSTRSTKRGQGRRARTSPAEQPVPKVWGDKWVAAADRPIHVTGMSNVWRVRLKSGSDDTFALKELRYAKSPGSTAYERFAREIEVLSALRGKHPAIVDILDHHSLGADSDERLYYVMPLAATSLLSAAKAWAGNPEHALVLIARVAEALVVTHQAGIVHRDIKPANVLLFGDEQQPRLADFGICYFVEEARLTRVDANTVGTDDYVAPELKGGGPKGGITPAADVYSLGKTLYAAIAGGRVFPRERFEDTDFNLVARFSDHRMEHINGILHRMVVEDPSERYQSMDECVNHLRQAIANIRDGIRYHPNMYGALASPEERLTRLSRSLNRLTEPERGDAIQDAIGESVESAHAIAVAYGAVSASDLRGGPSARGTLGDAVLECADELLPTGLIATLQDDRAAIEEWLSALRNIVENATEGDSHPEALLLPPAAVLATYGAGILSWRRRRFLVLNSIIEAHLRRPRLWIHHRILDGSSRALIPWVIDVLGQSRVLHRADRVLEGQLEPPIGVVAGLIMLRALLSISKTQLDDWAADPRRATELLVPAYPALTSTSLAWATALPHAFAENPLIELAVARDVFGLGPMELRSRCAEIVPLIEESVAVLMREEGKSSFWQHRFDTGPWAQWCISRTEP